MYSAIDGAVFSVNIAVTFIGLSAGLFVGTLVVRSFRSREEVKTRVLVAHFVSFVGPSIAYVVVIARDQSETGPWAFGLWLIALISTVANVLILWVDLMMQRAAAAALTGDDVGDRDAHDVAGSNEGGLALEPTSEPHSLEPLQPAMPVLALAAFAGALAGGLVTALLRRRP